MASIKFIEECKEDANCNRLGTIVVDGLEEPITNDDNLQSFSIDESCYVNGDIIGTVYIKKLNGQLLALPNDVNLAGKVIHARIGVKYADESVEYVEMGKYTIEHPKDEETADMCQITAYDDLTFKIDDEYVCGIDYSSGDKTLTDLYIDVCGQLGLIPKTANILNGNVPISANPFTNKEKNRLVLQTIGKVSCSYVVIDKETNEIDLCWLSEEKEPSYTFERGDYISLEGGKIQYGPINTVIIKNSQIDSENVTKSDEESVQRNGEHSIAISEDYILYNQDLRNLAMTAIYGRLLGLKYIEAKITTLYGKPFLRLGDKIRIITGNGYIDTYVLINSFTYDGTFKSIIDSPVLTEQELKAKQKESLSERIRRTEVEVNKQTGTIRELVEEVDEQTSKISDLEISADSINATVSETVDNMNAQETRMAELEAKASGLDITVKETRQTVESLGNLSDRVGSLEESDKTMLDSLNGTKADLESMKYSFTSKALKIGSEGDDNYSLYDNKGVRIYSLSALEAIYNKNGSGVRKLIITEGMQFQNLKMMPDNIASKNFSGSRKGIKGYYIDDLIQTLEDLEE